MVDWNFDGNIRTALGTQQHVTTAPHIQQNTQQTDPATVNKPVVLPGNTDEIFGKLSLCVTALLVLLGSLVKVGDVMCNAHNGTVRIRPVTKNHPPICKRGESLAKIFLTLSRIRKDVFLLE